MHQDCHSDFKSRQTDSRKLKLFNYFQAISREKRHFSWLQCVSIKLLLFSCYPIFNPWINLRSKSRIIGNFMAWEGKETSICSNAWFKPKITLIWREYLDLFLFCVLTRASVCRPFVPWRAGCSSVRWSDPHPFLSRISGQRFRYGHQNNLLLFTFW